MTDNILTYKGYSTKVEFSMADRVFWGRIEGLSDLVNFETDDPEKIEQEFHVAVDDYLAFCKDVGKEPDRPCGGVFQVRIPKDLHRKILIRSKLDGETLNAFVTKALRSAVE